MNRLLVWVVVIFSLALMLGATCIAVLAGPAEMQKQMFAQSVQLNGNCSGTLIYSDRDKATGKVSTLVLTAKHCVSGKPKREMTIDFPVYQDNHVVKYDRYLAKVKAQDYASDLALLELLDNSTYFAAPAVIAGAEEVIEMGDPVWTVGYPLGMTLTLTEGLFGALETINFPNDGDAMYRATPAIVFGNSGGGFFKQNAKGDYVLIGVTAAVMPGMWHLGYYTPRDAILTFLKRTAPAVVGGEAVTTGASR